MSADYEKVALAELPLLYRMAKRMTLSAVDAEDLVGQTLLAGARAWASFDGRYVRSWLIKILTNEHRGNLRKKAARPESIPLAHGVETAAPNALQEEVANRIMHAQIITELDNLPEEYRIAVALCDVEQMSYQEVADALNVPIGTVRSRLFRGRRMLRDKLVGVVENPIVCEIGDRGIKR